MPTRDLDIVLFGATGFTGALTAEYLARRAPAGLRWALAGRNSDKLASVRDRLTEIDPRLADLELLVADAADQDALATVAQRARVVATTVGPYVAYGEPLVAACAAAGTGYVDITGEAEFVDRMYVAHHETAVRSGARIVHACGFDSIPHDLGAYFTVRQLPVPEGVRVLTDPNQAVATVAPPMAEEVVAAPAAGVVAAAPAEPEVLTERKPKEEGAEDKDAKDAKKK